VAWDEKTNDDVEPTKWKAKKTKTHKKQLVMKFLLVNGLS